MSKPLPFTLVSLLQQPPLTPDEFEDQVERDEERKAQARRREKQLRLTLAMRTATLTAADEAMIANAMSIYGLSREQTIRELWLGGGL
jgi:hypothetical protein